MMLFLLLPVPALLKTEITLFLWQKQLKIFVLKLVFHLFSKVPNRSAVGSFRGPNMDEGLRVLSDVKNEVGVPVLTDVHLPNQCASVGEVVDILQIPAFLCRQTDLLIAAGETGKLVNIKKGQFLAPGKMIHAVEKVKFTGNNNILLTERGASFGYDLYF